MGYIGEKKKEYQRQWMKKRRDSYFKDKSCAHCRSTENLELDHINAEDKLINPANLWSMSDSNPRKIAELAKCQVLCHSCHLKKTYEQQEYVRGAKNASTKYSDEFVLYLRARYDRGESNIALAREFNVTRFTMHNLLFDRVVHSQVESHID